MKFFNLTICWWLLFFAMVAESFETPWSSEDSHEQDNGEVLVPIAFVHFPLASGHSLTKGTNPALKRNSEILNTLLGSGALNNMKNNGRRR